MHKTRRWLQAVLNIMLPARRRTEPNWGWLKRVINKPVQLRPTHWLNKQGTVAEEAHQTPYRALHTTPHQVRGEGDKHTDYYKQCHSLYIFFKIIIIINSTLSKPLLLQFILVHWNTSWKKSRSNQRPETNITSEPPIPLLSQTMRSALADLQSKSNR